VKILSKFDSGIYKPTPKGLEMDYNCLYQSKGFQKQKWTIRKIGATVAPTANNAASKTILKTILRDKNQLYRTVLVHFTSNDVVKTTKHLQMAGYSIVKK